MRACLGRSCPPGYETCRAGRPAWGQVPRNVLWLLGGTKLWPGGLCVCLPTHVFRLLCVKGFLPAPPQAPCRRLLHPPFTPAWGGSVGGQGRFVRGGSSCDRGCKGGCLQRDTSAAAAALALSCQCLWFYGTFITICHSFNGVACMSCHLPLPPCASPPAHTQHTHWGAQPYGTKSSSSSGSMLGDCGDRSLAGWPR